MHEMGICQGILDASLDAAKAEGATRIKEIRISVGELTEVVEYALQFAFEALTPGTLAEGSVLLVNHIPAKSRCLQCGAEYEHDRFDSTCPSCGNPFSENIAGRELLIDSLEIDTGDEAPEDGE